jgi:hypothetical protein
MTNGSRMTSGVLGTDPLLPTSRTGQLTPVELPVHLLQTCKRVVTLSRKCVVSMLGTQLEKCHKQVTLQAPVRPRLPTETEVSVWYALYIHRLRSGSINHSI